LFNSTTTPYPWIQGRHKFAVDLPEYLLDVYRFCSTHAIHLCFSIQGNEQIYELLEMDDIPYQDFRLDQPHGNMRA
jgi:hypothetical protein